MKIKLLLILSLLLAGSCKFLSVKQSTQLKTDKSSQDDLSSISSDAGNYMFVLSDWTSNQSDDEWSAIATVNSWISMTNLFTKFNFHIQGISANKIEAQYSGINDFILKHTPEKISEKSTFALQFLGHGGATGFSTACEARGYYTEEHLAKLLLALAERGARKFLLISESCNAGRVLGYFPSVFTTSLKRRGSSVSYGVPAFEDLSRKLKLSKNDDIALTVMYVGSWESTQGSYNYTFMADIPVRGIFSRLLPSAYDAISAQSATTLPTPEELQKQLVQKINETDLRLDSNKVQNLIRNIFIGSLYSNKQGLFRNGRTGLKLLMDLEASDPFDIKLFDKVSSSAGEHQKYAFDLQSNTFLKSSNDVCSKDFAELGFHASKDGLKWSGTSSIPQLKKSFVNCVNKRSLVQFQSGTF